MIGIDMGDEEGFVAAFENKMPSIIGEGRTMQALADVARAKLGEGCLDATVGVAVHAWYSDVERQALMDQARSAGFKTIRMVNRPTAVAMAHAALQSSTGSNVVVLEFGKERLDVTVLSKTAEGFDVMSADGCTPLDAATVSDSEKIFSKIEPAIHRALKSADVGQDKVSDVLCAGNPAGMESVRALLEGAFGCKISADIRPEHAVALGASVQAALVKKIAEPSAESTPAKGSSKGGGCLVVLAMVIAAIVVMVTGF